jgi:uncharacterized membrane protein YdfJ with MMPL/SSD domain
MFSMITGICFDYDIFLLVRITEYRADGIDPAASVRNGLVSTGGIITAAGVIMAIAFGGLLGSALSQVNVMGLMMVTATLYDTFLARCIVNPAVMSLIGRYNWWPSALSQDDKTGYVRLRHWDEPGSKVEKRIAGQVDCGNCGHLDLLYHDTRTGA